MSSNLSAQSSWRSTWLSANLNPTTEWIQSKPTLLWSNQIKTGTLQIQGSNHLKAKSELKSLLCYQAEVPNQQDAPNPPEGNNYLDNTSPSEYSGSEEESSSEDDEPSDKNEENNDLTDKTNVHNESPLTLSTIKEEI